LVSGTPADHAARAVRAALDSVKALAELNDPYFHKVKIGGASDDDCLIGAFGTSARLSYTVLGDGVNLAARLEPASAQCGTQNLFAESTFRLCVDDLDFAWRRWGRVRVIGKSEPVEVYEAFDALQVLDTSFITTFHLALDAFEHNDFDRARDLFVLADSQRPAATRRAENTPTAARCSCSTVGPSAGSRCLTRTSKDAPRRSPPLHFSPISHDASKDPAPDQSARASTAA